MNILSEVIIPLSGVVFPAVVAFIRAVYNRWGEGRKLHRDSQFDKVNVEKRLATFRRIKQLKNKNDLTPFDLLAIKALYEGIGIRYPVTISHKILEYIASNNIDFNEPTLNSFLRMSRLLNVTDSGVTQPSSKRKKARREIVIFGGLMIAAIIYGFFMSVPDVVAEMSGAAAVACFVVLFLVYLAMFILIVSAVVNSLYDIQCAKKFWKTFSPFLNRQP
ncbi:MULTISPECIES: hypothetical protein [Raoultella]|uniref:hypothetical protein n=1 Tax=Raoultella TaxID=160674 RepID=UPI00071EDF26|nr:MULTISPECIES: hypothetical protein [Raoultella]ALQ46928.1 hypothetical protein ATN83_2813 [Raoultella ornithinolytica]AXC30417.1 hypothetical protein DSD31_13540 [Raoultella sp. X13]EKR9382524.1 hypothetical protein [Raoultella ornithinolytica]EKV0508275.1 hypothetical protein [Raoultella ornithinolytica]EKX4890806.1 hypothetical protein [Raoultella ornithinolytica]